VRPYKCRCVTPVAIRISAGLGVSKSKTAKCLFGGIPLNDTGGMCKFPDDRNLDVKTHPLREDPR
jgi:hypothetical protein